MCAAAPPVRVDSHGKQWLLGAPSRRRGAAPALLCSRSGSPAPRARSRGEPLLRAPPPPRFFRALRGGACARTFVRAWGGPLSFPPWLSSHAAGCPMQRQPVFAPAAGRRWSAAHTHTPSRARRPGGPGSAAACSEHLPPALAPPPACARQRQQPPTLNSRTAVARLLSPTLGAPGGWAGWTRVALPACCSAGATRPICRRRALCLIVPPFARGPKHVLQYFLRPHGSLASGSQAARSGAAFLLRAVHGPRARAGPHLRPHSAACVSTRPGTAALASPAPRNFYYFLPGAPAVCSLWSARGECRAASSRTRRLVFLIQPSDRLCIVQHSETVQPALRGCVKRRGYM